MKSSPFIKKWYESLKTQPDYSLYDSKYYLFAGFLSYKHWSRHYIKTIEKQKLFNIDDVKIVIDFGNGLGFSSIDLAKLFNKATIFGTNIANTYQMKFAEALISNINNIHIVDEEKLESKNCDIAFCSEYFEHFYEPIKHLQYLIDKYNPKYFVIANAFGVLAVGHFETYKVDNEIVDSNRIKKMFSETLKKNNYIKVKHSGWNNRPNVFVRNN